MANMKIIRKSFIQNRNWTLTVIRYEFAFQCKSSLTEDWDSDNLNMFLELHYFSKTRSGHFQNLFNVYKLL
jgi:hypothetical protein